MSMGRRLLHSDRNAMLLIDVLRSNVKAGKFRIDDFVIMPDHVHLLITVGPDMTIERAKEGFRIGSRKSLAMRARFGSEDFRKSASTIARTFCSVASTSHRIQ